MKEYKISCENAEVKAEAIKLFEVLGCRDYSTKDKYLDLVVHPDGDIQSVTRQDFNVNYPIKQITIEKLRKIAKPTECLVKTDNGWECKVLPKSLIGGAVKIPKKANFAVESLQGSPAFYQSEDTRTYIGGERRKWTHGGRGLCGRTPIWQRTVKSKFIIKTKFAYEVQELPKDTPVTWHCIPFVDGVPESDQVAFYELCDKVEAVDFMGAKWMRENIENYSRALLSCFIFNSTPQGTHYWKSISNLIK